MKQRLIPALALCLLTALPAQAVEFWHAGTVWGGQGLCAARFEFDSGHATIVDLEVAVSLVDAAGKEVDSGRLTVDRFGGSSVDRYASAMLEGEALCSDDLAVVVTAATATVDGRQQDLLESKGLSARAFRPFAIRVP